ncbi:MAG: hypothetical protein ACRYGL_09530 [Janthinobacterium lividum]
MQSMVKKWIPTFCLLLGSLCVGQAIAQTTTQNGAPEGATHKERRAMKAQAKADKQTSVAQAKADKAATKAQGEADDKAADARLDSAKKQ